MTNQKTGIWGNTECVQCGACCYEHNNSLEKKPCENQEIRDGKSYCLKHDTPQERRWPQCEPFFCGDILPSDTLREEVAERLRKGLFSWYSFLSG